MGLAGHSGGTDANGCHMDRKAGTRHCHRPKLGGAAARVRRSSSSEVYYPNCAAARAAGVRHRSGSETADMRAISTVTAMA
ncbi:YHYH domain-containing protein [Sphingomonas suaedae]|uniref:YHYH domain-containing protein n=1 Tax=Sphingomonas suaedae TaxID=2599297 RepID=A0A518RKV3_9SPHN|nr:YHYH domain-containing protein [Sphingomonas suaedae]